MTATSTAHIFVSPQGGGPFNGPVWRIGVTAQLVENSAAPYWLWRRPESIEDNFVPIPVMDDWTVAQSVLFMLALAFATENDLMIFEEHHNLVTTERGFQVSECWDLSDEEIRLCKSIIWNRIRIGLTILEPNSLVTSATLREIDDLGIEMEVFGRR